MCTGRCVQIFILAVLLAGGLTAQDFRENISRSMFSDQKAFRIGDAVTILVIETSSASNDASTSSSRESGISVAESGKLAGKSLPEIGLSLGTGNKFKGEGSTSTQGSVRAKISARVDSVFKNGNLYVNGSRSIIINGEEQLIKISGVIRPSDVQPDNSVYSFNISDASIVFQGTGLVSQAQQPGWLTKLFHWIF